MRIFYANAEGNPVPAYRLHKDSDSCYPKGTGTRSVTVLVTINGEPGEIRVTNSGSWATAKTSGDNGWIRFGGKTYWWLFESGRDARKLAGTAFVVDDGVAPAPAKRNPRDAKGEKARTDACKATFAAKRNASVPAKLPEDEVSEYETGKPVGETVEA